MERIYNVGVIGCGQIAQIMHMPYINDSPMLRLHSICDISKAALKGVSERFHIPAEHVYTDFNSMVQDTDIDIVLVCCRDHYAPAMAAISAGKHVYIEKPLAFNLRQADDIINNAHAHGVKTIVGYMKFYDPAYKYFQKKIKGILEHVSYARVHDYAGSFDFTNTIYDLFPAVDLTDEVKRQASEEEDKALLEQIGVERRHLIRAYSRILGLSSHDTILMRNIFGDDYSVPYATVDGNNYLTAMLDFGRFKCAFESAFVTNRRSWDETFQVYSPELNACLEFPWPYQKNAPTKVHLNENEEGTMINVDKTVVSSFEEAYRCEWQHFIDCIINDKTPDTCAEEARKDIELADRVIKAVRID